MQLIIYCCIALVTLGAADPKPQRGISSSLATGKKIGKRPTTPELTLYLTQDVLKAIQAVKTSKKSESSIETPEQNSQANQENYNQAQKYYGQPSQPSAAEIPQKKSRGFVSRFFIPKEDGIKHQDNNDFAKFYMESQKIQDSLYKQLQNSQLNNANKVEFQTPTNSVPYVPVSIKNQEEILLHEQLKQHWNRILDHNRAQLQGLSESEQQNKRDSLRQLGKTNRQQKPSRFEAQQDTRTVNPKISKTDQKSEVEKEIESIIRNHQALNIATSNSPDQNNNQGPPILIHREVKITKHHPVPVYRRVEVPVPRPVLVPVPEPYAVKVPHPYPVPVDIIKHIPIPVIRNS